MLSVRLTRTSGQGTFFVRATDGGERFEAQLRFDGDRLRYDVLYIGNSRQGVALLACPAVPGAADNPSLLDKPAVARTGEIPGADDRRLIEVSLIDRQFLLAIDGRTVVRWPFERRSPPAAPVSTPLAIGVQGLGVSVAGLRVFRDVYYTQPIGSPPRGPVRLGGDEYYVLGDNSPISEDSRYWPGGGVVEGNLLVGKPLAALPLK